MAYTNSSSSLDPAAQLNLRTTLLEPVLNTYAIIFFARGPAFGAVLLAATFLAPLFGLFGLAGVVTALVAARILGFSEAGLRSGLLLFNSLLTALGLAYLTQFHSVPPALLVVLLPAVSLLALLLSVTWGRVMRQLFGLPALSSPFVGATVMLFLLFYSFTGTPVLGRAPVYLLPEPSILPGLATLFLQALGAAFFLPHALVGAAILVALLFHSRLLVVLALWGYGAGMAFMQLSGLSSESLGAGWLGTNFLYCGIALGGVFLVPGRATLLLAATGTVFGALLAIGMQTFFRSFNIPPLSLPFNLVVMMVLYALRQRENARMIFESPYPDLPPEVSVRLFHCYGQRFPHALLPALYLPFSGNRVVTQGFHGKLTHHGVLAHALDFEALDSGGQPLPPQYARLEDAYTFGTPVLAPCDGTVVRAVAHVADNQLGEQNIHESWGNLVTLVTDWGLYVTLCHFKQYGLSVYQGQRVYCGQLLGYCGNSGRSPLPHLHMQMQTDPAMGSPTIPFCTGNYITMNPENGRCFHLSGIPTQGTRLEPMGYEPELAACFEVAAPARMHYRIEAEGKPPVRETIEVSSSPRGERFYRSLQRGARLRASTAGGVFTVLSFEGPVTSLLSSMWLGLSLLPFYREANLCWEDRFDPRPFFERWRGWAADLTEPFTGLALGTLQHRFEEDASGNNQRITTEVVLPARRKAVPVPRRIDIQLAPGDGLVNLTVTTGERIVHIVQEGQELLS